MFITALLNAETMNCLTTDLRREGDQPSPGGRTRDRASLAVSVPEGYAPPVLQGSARRLSVLTLASGVPGTGKTMLAAHLGVQSMESFLGPVAVIDCDPAAHLSAWHGARTRDDLTLVRARPETICDVLEDLENRGVRLAIIDTPAAALSVLAPIVAVSDTVVIPQRPAETTPVTAPTFAEELRCLRTPFVFVLNGARVDSEDTSGDVLLGLAHHGTLATAIIPDSRIFSVSMSQGWTVMEADIYANEGREIARLTQYLAHHIECLREEAAVEARIAGSRGERRFFGRKAVGLPATLWIGARSASCVVVDISAGGMGIEYRGTVKAGEWVEIEICHVGRLRAEVRHVDEGRLGLQFAKAPHPSLFGK